VERIAIFAALQWECRPVLQQLRQVSRERAGDFTVWRGTTPRYEVLLVKTGMGLTQADAAARSIGDGDYALFVSTGCAGALAAELTPGDLTVATTVVASHSGEGIETHAEHRERVEHAALRAALHVTAGPVLCSPQALLTAEDKCRAATRHGAVAVEMEGAAIGAEAARRGIPFLSVRAILDTANTELKHTGRFVDPQSGAVKPLALAGYLATHPGAVSDLLAMQRMMRAAQTSLDRFFAVWLSTPDC
jgi:adenosylhomocysteine nucleosidase